MEQQEPKTAMEEAIVRVMTALEQSHDAYRNLSFFAFRKRYYTRGVIHILTIIVQMLDSLNTKYNNSTGRFN